jgi:hypothetical protein
MAAGEPWVAARLALEIGIAPMVAAGERERRLLQQWESKHNANFRHGEISAKERCFICGRRVFHVEHSGEE